MARCGCQGGCSCAVEGSGLVQVGGSGAPSDPFVVGLSYEGKTGCDAIAACVGDHVDTPLVYDEATGQLQLWTSQDAGNLVQVGSDGGLYVPTAGASAGLVQGQAVDISGDQASGYVVGVRISTDPGNSLRLGEDGGLYVRVPQLQQRVESVSFRNLSSYTRIITFPEPFDTVPVVDAFITTGNGAAVRWGARAINVAATGFTMFLFSGESGTSSTWSNLPVGWRATTP